MKKAIVEIILFCLTAIYSASIVSADVVELKNGSKIIGTIEKLDKNKIRINTDFAGILSINLNKVISISTDNPLYLSFANRDRVFGKLIWSKEQILIEKSDGSTFVSKDPPEMAWQEIIPDPFVRHWTFDLGFDMAGKTGNTEKNSAGGKAQAKMQGPDDRLLFYLKYAYAEDEGINSENSIISGVDFERYLEKYHSLYARTEFEHDRIKGLELRSTAAVGYGYYFLKKNNHELRGRTGLLYYYDSWSADPSNSTIGMDFGLSHMFQFANDWKVLNEVVYDPSLENLNEYRLYHESSLFIPLASSKIWKLQFGLSNDYSGHPAENKEYLNTTYFMRVVFKWR